MTHEQLGQSIKAAAYLEGDFVLRSGKRSRYYLDKYLFETDPALLRELAKLLATHVTPQTTRIAGAELGAVALAAATSLECGKPFVIIRNSRKADYGTGKLVEGRLTPTDHVLLVEDIVTSGGQAVEAVRVLREAGATVERLVAVIDREEGGRATIEKSGVPYTALFTSSKLGIAAPATRT